MQLELRRLARANEAFGAILDDASFEVIDDDAPDDLEADDGISDGPVVRLVNSIIFQAAEDGASDVHLEPQEDALVVRLRVDGVLSVAQRIPRQFAAGVTTRIKVLAKLDIAERRKPQDGRITLGAAAAGRMLDIRVATLPTVEGESVVLRLLDKSQARANAARAWVLRGHARDVPRRRQQADRRSARDRPDRLGQVDHALCRAHRDQPTEINVITVEDPVEYRARRHQPGADQHRAGLTFASVLRSILRSDPDVIMVGEIRDAETAKISIEAALTGHFVLSTLHTNDAPGALTRLTEMGVEQQDD